MWSNTLCNRTGHIASVCWDLAEPGGQSNVSDSSVTVTRSERREPVVCYSFRSLGTYRDSAAELVMKKFKISTCRV